MSSPTATYELKMSSISPQISRVLEMETTSSDSSAIVVRLHIKTKTKSVIRKLARTQYSYKVMPLRDEDDIPVIINILHGIGGAKAPYLPSDDAPDSP
jgi:hypothetical protein